MSSNLENYSLALRLQHEQKYKEAIELAGKISRPEFRATILIDSGNDTGKPRLVREGIELLETALKGDQKKISRASLLYNIGNGYSALYKLRRQKGVRVIAPNDDDLRMAKKAYREALAETKDAPPSLRSQILVNYGNCLSALGRSIEAVQAYQSALDIEPKNGMAAGNLGIQLERVARITGRYTHHYIMAAQEALKTACGHEMHLSYGGIDAAPRFDQTLHRLQRLIDVHEDRLQPLEKIAPPQNRTARSRYTQFCLKHRLFLNAWVGDQSVTPARSDEIAFGPITTSLDDDQTVPELLRIFNEIKEAYTTARYLFYLSESSSRCLDDISDITNYFDAEFEDLHGLYIGLCKSAYMRSFDVLDKVARIVNVYFKIGKRMDSFGTCLQRNSLEANRMRCGLYHAPQLLKLETTASMRSQTSVSTTLRASMSI